MKPRFDKENKTLPPRLVWLREAARKWLPNRETKVLAVPPCTVHLPPESPVSGAGLYCVEGFFQGSFFYFGQQKIVIGRDPACCNIVFPASARGISACHCELIWDQNSGTMVCRDLGSTYGTILFDGNRLAAHEMAVLRGGQGFLIGENNRFILRIP